MQLELSRPLWSAGTPVGVPSAWQPRHASLPASSCGIVRPMAAADSPAGAFGAGAATGAAAGAEGASAGEPDPPHAATTPPTTASVGANDPNASDNSLRAGMCFSHRLHRQCTRLHTGPRTSTTTARGSIEELDYATPLCAAQYQNPPRRSRPSSPHNDKPLSCQAPRFLSYSRASRGTGRLHVQSAIRMRTGISR